VEKEHHQFEPIIKTLLRDYEGGFDQPVPVAEKMMAGLMKKDVEEVKKQLTQLQQAGIISYQPQKDTPQLLLLRNRIKCEDIVSTLVDYETRKEMFKKRMKQINKKKADYSGSTH